MAMTWIRHAEPDSAPAKPIHLLHLTHSPLSNSRHRAHTPPSNNYIYASPETALNSIHCAAVKMKPSKTTETISKPLGTPCIDCGEFECCCIPIPCTIL